MRMGSRNFDGKSKREKSEMNKCLTYQNSVVEFKL